MEQRKLIKLGNSSFAIALPKDWVLKSGLKKGDKIFIIPNSHGELMISPEFKKGNGDKEIFLDFENKKEDEINRELIASYINGNGIFKIKCDKKNIKFIKKILHDLPGLELIEQNQDELVIKDLTDINSISISSIIKRIDNIIRSFFEDIELGIKKGKITKNQYNEIRETDKEINKFYFLLWKVMVLGMENPSTLNTLETDYPSLVHTWWVGTNLEKIGDNLKRISKIAINKKLENNNNLLEFFQKIKGNHIKILNAFYKKDKEIALEIANNKNELYKECNSVCGDTPLLKNELNSIITHLHYISKCILYFIK